MILVIDNYDSFTYNLVHYLNELGAETRVHRNDDLSAEAALALRPDAVLLSPGPCSPAEAGCSLAAVRAFRGRLPILGVCLGHQAVAAALGGRIVRAAEPVHGRASDIHHDATDLFAGIPSPMSACRYHSLVVAPDDLPAGLAVTARTADGTIMAVADERHAIYGVQFHPESILTRGGFRLLANFLERAGIPHHGRLAAALDDLVALQAGAVDPQPAGPQPVVTF